MQQNLYLSDRQKCWLSFRISTHIPEWSVSKTQILTIHYIHCTNTSERSNIPLNNGESNVTSRVNWKLYVNGSQVTYTSRYEDYSSATGDGSYGIGAFAYYKAPVDAGSSLTIRVDVYNAIATSRTCRVYVNVVLCPWIIPPTAYEPMTLDFPQGSTLYIVTEPLIADPTKNSKIGKTRAVSFGDSSDYYSTASGTGILTHSYTFETVQVDECILSIDGNGACVSIIAVDLR